VYMSSNAGGATDSRIIAFTVDPNYTGVAGRRDILTGITYLNSVHCGGRIRFGPDNYLYVTTGDTRQGSVPQSLTALGAKVLRIDRDGNAAPGNNTPAGGHPAIYAYGFRNVQGIAFRPGSGTPYISEHGPGYSDEVTPLRAGGNGGWDPFCAGGSEHGVKYCGYNGTTSMTDTSRFPNAMLPAWNNGGLSEGMSGSAFLAGAQWRDWHGALVVGLMAGRRLELLKLDAAGTAATNTPLLNTFGVRLRAPVLAPDGSLYITTDGIPGGDEIWRLVAN
jgi:aldose sugar dehydrogenase